MCAQSVPDPSVRIAPFRRAKPLKTYLLLIIFALLVCGALAQPVTTLTNYASSTATLRFLPELWNLSRAPVGDDIQSVIFHTTTLNREIRRGFLEFPGMVLTGYLQRATLEISEWRGVSGFPVPPVRHALSFYSTADLIISTNDWTNTVTPLLYFETDENVDPQVFRFDVTAALRAAAGNPLGFRINIDHDLELKQEGGFGTGFLPASSPDRPRILIELSSQPVLSLSIISPLQGQQ